MSAIKYTQLTELTKSRLMDLLFERRDMGPYGLGKDRSLDEFAKFSGIDYAKRTVVQAHHPGSHFEPM